MLHLLEDLKKDKARPGYYVLRSEPDLPTHWEERFKQDIATAIWRQYETLDKLKTGSEVRIHALGDCTNLAGFGKFIAVDTIWGSSILAGTHWSNPERDGRNVEDVPRPDKD